MLKLSAFNGHAYFENCTEAVVIVNSDAQLLFCNPAFMSLTGFDLNEVELHKLLPENADNWQHNRAGCNAQKYIACKNGGSKLVNICISSIALTENSTGLVYTFIDLTEVAKQLNIAAQNELAHLNTELRRSNEELEQFAYVASHDLQEPLRMVNSYIQLIRKHVDKGDVTTINDFMTYVIDGASRMQSLINDLLQFSRVNRKGGEFTDVDLNDIIIITLGHLTEKVKDSNALVTYIKMPVVKGDTFQLIRLFQNLVDNAIKFQAPGRQPEITISVKEQEKNYLFEVKDNGIGIENKFHNRIFAIFQRLHTRAEYEGTGIGLSVCKKIVERHGGDIWIESQPGEGSTFYFTIKK